MGRPLRSAQTIDLFVMPGHSSLPCADCVNLSAMPGIHVSISSGKKDVDGRGEPGHDELRQASASRLTP
jgi:hypothetical protein